MNGVKSLRPSQFVLEKCSLFSWAIIVAGRNKRMHAGHNNGPPSAMC